MDQNKLRLMEIVGSKGVQDHPDLGESFSLDHKLTAHFFHPFGQTRNVDEAQKMFYGRTKRRLPWYPSARGPHFHGDTLPTSPDSVMLDLSGMNRVLKINRRNRLALIEPGVTYSQLIPALHTEELRIAMPLLPRANKSVLASLLEREPVMTPKYQWNFLDPLRSMEIVWGNGEKFFSGSGGYRAEKDEDWEAGLVPVQGPGPGQLDFYKFVSAAQGSMGIATWASIKCEAYPELHKLYLIPGLELETLIEFMYKLVKFRFGDELFIVNRACLAYMLGGEHGEIESLKNLLPEWTVIVGICGGLILPEERVAAQESDIHDLAAQSGLSMLSAIEGCTGSDLLELIQNPSPEPYWKLRFKGGSQEIFFLTTLDKSPGFITEMKSAAREHQYPVQDIGVYLQPVHQGVGCHCEFILPFDRANQAEANQVERLFRDASQRLFKQKAYYSRPYGIWADMVYNADPMTRQVTQKMKEIFDPNHVMNPGKLCF
jgi:FAD/FMN-containing dehydrogenase